MILVLKVVRVKDLIRLLTECNLPFTCIHAGMRQDVRIPKYKSFKDVNVHILVLTDLFRRGIDIEQVNVAINYDFPHE